MMSGSSHLFFLDRNKIPVNLEIHGHYFDLSGKSGTVCLCLSWASVCWFDVLLLQPTLSWTSLPSPRVDYVARYVSNWLLSLESPPVDYVAGRTGIHNITPGFNNLRSRRRLQFHRDLKTWLVSTTPSSLQGLWLSRFKTRRMSTTPSGLNGFEFQDASHLTKRRIHMPIQLHLSGHFDRPTSWLSCLL